VDTLVSDPYSFPQSHIPVLPSSLEKVIATDRVKNNVANYPELQMPISELQKKRLAEIRKTLLEIPLIYTSGQQLPEGVDIQPKSRFEENSSHGLEKDMGLDSCVFLSWGLPEQTVFGNNFLLLSPKLLFEPQTLVTPTAMRAKVQNEDLSYTALAPDVRKRFDIEYLNMMVRGSDWFEIVARRVLLSFERKNNLFPLFSFETLGEIKYFSVIDHKYIQKQITEHEIKSLYKFLYEHGFCFYNMEQTRRMFYATGMILGVDPLPEDCDINYNDVSDYWRRKLDPNSEEAEEE
jgi:hypothetical protein